MVLVAILPYCSMKRIICLIGVVALLGSGCVRSASIPTVSTTTAASPLEASLDDKGILVVQPTSTEGADIYPFTTKEELYAFTQLVGPEYAQQFTERFVTISRPDAITSGSIRVYEGAVPGLYTMMEGLIAVESPTRVWAAVIDGDVVRYFSTVPEDTRKLPAFVDSWRARFAEKLVVYMNAR